MEYKSLKELSQFIKNGATIKQDGTSTLGYPITRIETLADDKFNRDRMGYAGITDLTEYANYVLENGDIIGVDLPIDI
jgi:type I restriction enzyme S subunit